MDSLNELTLAKRLSFIPSLIKLKAALYDESSKAPRKTLKQLEKRAFFVAHDKQTLSVTNHCSGSIYDGRNRPEAAIESKRITAEWRLR